MSSLTHGRPAGKALFALQEGKENRTCALLEQYLNYLTIVKGRSTLTANEYRIDVLMLFDFIKEKEQLKSAVNSNPLANMFGK